MKQLVFGCLVLAGVGIAAHAAEPSVGPCLSQLAQSEKWASVSEDKMKCLLDGSESAKRFYSAMSGLCSASGSDVSEMYSKYRSYREKFESKLKELNSATDNESRERLRDDLVDLERDWQDVGSRDEVRSRLGTMQPRLAICGVIK